MTTGVKAPLGFFTIGSFNISDYTVVIIIITVVIYFSAFVLFRRTKFGLIARATLSNPEQASALGIRTPKVYMVTFGIGTALTGLAGALLAPMNSIIADDRRRIHWQGLYPVISGGTAAIVGTATASTISGTLAQLVTFQTTPVLQVAMASGGYRAPAILPRGYQPSFSREQYDLAV